jgi:hypothetical protein
MFLSKPRDILSSVEQIPLGLKEEQNLSRSLSRLSSEKLHVKPHLQCSEI